jgi:antirestriction protein ArdC
MRDIYRTITDQIIAELKTGVRPWVKPWSQTPGLNIPANAVIGRPYSGVNTLLLWTARHHNWQPRFLTFKQALETGGHVRKGEHGHHIVFVKDLVRQSRDEGDEETYRVRMMKSYVVFNIAQCDELPDRLTAPPKVLNPDQRDCLVDEFIAATGVRISENAFENTAAYIHTDDVIVMPAFGSFRGQPEYYATIFHELVHSTGHPSRLNRQLGARFGLQSKAAEELIAELGAAFLCAEFSIDGFIPHAAYIESYLQLLENDAKAIFTAASKAQAAVDFLRQKILAEPATVVPVTRQQSQLRQEMHHA